MAYVVHTVLERWGRRSAREQLEGSDLEVCTERAGLYNDLVEAGSYDDLEAVRGPVMIWKRDLMMVWERALDLEHSLSDSLQHMTDIHTTYVLNRRLSMRPRPEERSTFMLTVVCCPVSFGKA
jgi:hypothetical protein